MKGHSFINQVHAHFDLSWPMYSFKILFFPIDTDTGIMIDINQQYQKVSVATQEEGIGTGVSQRIMIDSNQQFQKV